MKKHLAKICILAALMAMPVAAHADEGMWMIQAIDKALSKNMKARGLKLSANEIYNADAEGASLSDAIVSLDFGCTCSVISDEGLVITNHHCAYADVHKLSTAEHNYLDNGFWAMTRAEEKYIPGKGMWFLKKVVDVTEQTLALKKKLESEGKHFGLRKVAWMMEKEYAEDGLEASFSSMWSGSKFYMAYYKVYRDVRLVAAPPVSIAAFGGDTDNWEWPQHKCDFAMYRIYTAPDGSPAEYSENNVPLHPSRKLDISLDGYKKGDFTMVIGYPGRTDRYSSSAKVLFQQDVTLPISNELRGKQMELIKAAMDRDPAVRLKYADRFFMLSNVQELQVGTVECFKRFKVAQEKADQEKELAEWINADPQRQQKWGTLLEDLATTYNAVSETEKDVTYYRETLIRGCQMSLVSTRLANICNDGEKSGAESFTADKNSFSYKALCKLYDGMDLGVEKELFDYSVETFFRNVNPKMFSHYQKELLEKFCAITADRLEKKEKLGSEIDSKGLEAMTQWLWDNSITSSEEKVMAFLSENHTAKEYRKDPIMRFFGELKIAGFNKRITAIEGSHGIAGLNKEYTHALYRMREDKGVAQYPDANSTMRITYGTVGALDPKDGVHCSWRSTTTGILQKNDPENYDFCLNERSRTLLESQDWGRWYYINGKGCKNGKGNAGDSINNKCGKGNKNGFGKDGICDGAMPVDFICDCDITGGNSGSPVLNAKGELIGLAFDGNKESLAGDASFTEGYNKCVCVDIRYVLWTLDRYAGMEHILKEIGF